MTGRVFGVDEAGKGPVLGSMFAAAVVADPDSLPAGVDDSKCLPPDLRETIAVDLRAADDVAVGVAEIPTAEIDDPATDMNTLTVEAHARALAQVAEDGLAGVVDAGDTSEERFAARVTERVPVDVDLAAEHGADESHVVVGAASIVAKVARDAHVARLADEYDADLGSGYPSDPATKTFLDGYVAEHGALPDCARASWATSEKALARAEQAGLGDF
ncbi:ribonuclease HII [Halobacteriaceae archaeon GCM10025711]